ncbi:uncharacterized protein METZ01_LOCUS225971 [marine metagenome]|uniref:Uncharacterized protein n=1 Tax=marine metagenome TaxID=408172 RepID=A0A382GET2_9ZZZZ
MNENSVQDTPAKTHARLRDETPQI